MKKGAGVSQRPLFSWLCGLGQHPCAAFLCLSPQTPAQAGTRGARRENRDFRRQPRAEASGVSLCLVDHAGAGQDAAAGKRTVTVVPAPTRLATVTSPPCSSAMRLTIARPSPLPPSPVDGATLARLW